MNVCGGEQGSSSLGLSLPVRWQRLMGWPFGKGKEAEGLCQTLPSLGPHSTPPIACLQGTQVFTFQGEEPEAQRVESFTRVAHSTEPGLPESRTRIVAWKWWWMSLLYPPWLLLVSETTRSTAEAQASGPPEVNPGSSHCHLKPLHSAKFMPGPA